MAQLTIKQFADLHGVTPRAIRFAVEANGWAVTERYGVQTLNSALKYEPVRGRGRRPVRRPPKK